MGVKGISALIFFKIIIEIEADKVKILYEILISALKSYLEVNIFSDLYI